MLSSDDDSPVLPELLDQFLESEEIRALLDIYVTQHIKQFYVLLKIKSTYWSQRILMLYVPNPGSHPA